MEYYELGLINHSAFLNKALSFNAQNTKQKRASIQLLLLHFDFTSY